MREVRIEMTDFHILNPLMEETIKGSFIVKKYGSLMVGFTIENNNILFENVFNDKESINCFTLWSFHEKDVYTTFFLNLLNDITRINDLSSFEGVIEDEFYRSFLRKKMFFLKIQYKDITAPIKFVFDPILGNFKILYRVLIPTNCQERCPNTLYIQHMLSEETIQRMWEPFRDKTAFRLPLLNELR